MEEAYEFTCPHCWQVNDIMLDVTAGGQRYVQDCGVCCNPLDIAYDVCDGAISGFEVSPIDQ